LILVWLLLPLVGVRRLRAWTDNGAVLASGYQPGPAAIARRVRALRGVAARLPGCHCLARSLALGWWLHRHGIKNRLRIGVTGTHANLRSHSWIEVDGQPIDDTHDNIKQFNQILHLP